MSQLEPISQTLRPAPDEGPAAPAIPVIHYKTVRIDDVNVFYREAGPADAPVLLLLHGFPTSSHMFRNLIPLLADRYRVIAPDYPGYGQSDAPKHTEFAYTFTHLANIIDQFTVALGAGLWSNQIGVHVFNCDHGKHNARRSGGQVARKYGGVAAALEA